jgi:N-acetyl-gamma-glutamyl-phosphate reductase
MIRAKVVGAGGYGGVGITELLLRHPEAEIGCLVSLSDTGRRMSDVFPHLRGFCDEVIVSPEDPKTREAYDVVFFSTPDRVGMQHAGDEIERGAKVIDYSGDFRFGTPEQYAEYANFIGLEPVHLNPALLTETVYGLPELHEIGESQVLVGNPGCFAVSCILGLAPAASAGIINMTSIICDCKTGISGAGKKPSGTFHYPNRYDNMNAYRLSGHQHMVEIEQELAALSGEEARITFTAQAVPVCRGIMSADCRCRHPGRHRRCARQQLLQPDRRRGCAKRAFTGHFAHRQPHERPGGQRVAEHEPDVWAGCWHGTCVIRAVPLNGRPRNGAWTG